MSIIRRLREGFRARVCEAASSEVVPAIHASDPTFATLVEEEASSAPLRTQTFPADREPKA